MCKKLEDLEDQVGNGPKPRTCCGPGNILSKKKKRGSPKNQQDVIITQASTKLDSSQAEEHMVMFLCRIERGSFHVDKST